MLQTTVNLAMPIGYPGDLNGSGNARTINSYALDTTSGVPVVYWGDFVDVGTLQGTYKPMSAGSTSTLGAIVREAGYENAAGGAYMIDGEYPNGILKVGQMKINALSALAFTDTIYVISETTDPENYPVGKVINVAGGTSIAAVTNTVSLAGKARVLVGTAVAGAASSSYANAIIELLSV